MKSFKKTKWNNLVVLQFSNKNIKIDKCCLENESISVLSKCKWKHLDQLSLDQNKITDNSIESLNCANWP